MEFPISKAMLQEGVELKKNSIRNKHTENSLRYARNIVEKICDEILELLPNSENDIKPNTKYVYKFDILENVYTLKVVRDALKSKFPDCVFELDAEHKFVSMDWS
jgi:hypothetical protein